MNFVSFECLLKYKIFEPYLFLDKANFVVVAGFFFFKAEPIQIY